jgi:16S rRNA processing protein RimM
LDALDSTTLENVSRITLENKNYVCREYMVRAATRLGSKAIRLVLEDVATVEAAAVLRGGTILVAEADLPSTEPHQFYTFRAIGCEVVTSEGRRLGTVDGIFATAANDVMVVRDGSAEVLIPVIADVVKNLDFTARRITIDELPGLLV